jgi:hypothetical protein
MYILDPGQRLIDQYSNGSQHDPAASLIFDGRTSATPNTVSTHDLSNYAAGLLYAAAAIEVSIDNGGSYIAVGAGRMIAFDAPKLPVRVRSASASVRYSIRVGNRALVMPPVITVGASGDVDCTNPQSAIDAASAGDLVLGYPGASRTYTEKAGVKILFLEDVADMVMAYDANINALRVSQVTKISGEDTNNDRITTMPKYAYTNIIGAVADTEVKAGPGVVAKIVVNTAGAAGSTITLYDGPVATGTVIAIIDGTALGTYSYDVSCETSIHVATVDGAGTLNITVLSV